MKHLLRISLFLLFFSTAALHAQIEPGISIAYGFDVKTIGVEARLQIGTLGIENLRVVPSFTWFLTENYEFFTVDANLQYMLLNTDEGGRGWVLGGLDVARSSAGDGNTSIGANVGAGGSGNIGILNLFGEAKYVFGNASQFVLTTGIFF